MYISDKDALQLASKFILVLVPVFSSLFDTWSWIIEILLLFTVFIHSRASGLRSTALVLAVGYLASLIAAGPSGISHMGFSPWAGMVFLGQKERGLSTPYSMFWGLISAAFLSALPVVPFIGQALRPENLQAAREATIQLYEQQGMLQSLQEQGIEAADLEKYLTLLLPIYYKLLPALAGILGMFEIGAAYLLARIPLKRTQKSKPFALLTFPWYSIWFSIAGLAAYLGGGYLQESFLEIAGLNIMVVMVMISLVLGFAWLSFMLKHPKMPRMLIWIILFAAIFMPYFVLLGLVFIGLFDPVMNLRRIPENYMGGKQ